MAVPADETRRLGGGFCRAWPGVARWERRFSLDRQRHDGPDCQLDVLHIVWIGPSPTCLRRCSRRPPHHAGRAARARSGYDDAETAVSISRAEICGDNSQAGCRRVIHSPTRDAVAASSRSRCGRAGRSRSGAAGTARAAGPVERRVLSGACSVENMPRGCHHTAPLARRRA